MKYRVSELEGALLDAAVAEAVGLRWRWSQDMSEVIDTSIAYAFAPSRRWSEGGPIIERERIATYPGAPETGNWFAYTHPRERHWDGPTPLIAAMRAYVAAKLGPEVELPEAPK